METTTNDAVQLTGIIDKYKTNKHGDIDAVEIDKAGRTEKINFPPHTARAVMNVANEGENVEIIYNEDLKKGPEANKKSKNKLVSIRLVNSANTLMIADIHPQKPGFHGTSESFEIDAFELLNDKKGELIAIRSANNLFHIHKEIRSFSEMIKNEPILKITALKRVDEGFINAEHLKVYHIQSYDIDGKEYFSKKQ